MDTQILPASEAEGHRPPVHPEGRRVTSHESPVTVCKLFSFTLLSKNAPANHLESHSCKNKGLKVPCFHTLTEKGVGQGVRPGDTVIPSEPAILAGDEGSQCSEGHEPQSANHGSLVTDHGSRCLTPLDSALTSKRASKSFTCNTYEKHTQGEGWGLPSFEFRVSSFDFWAVPRGQLK
jgi:hypothetical protein